MILLVLRRYATAETGIIHLYIIYYILEHESKIWVFKFFDSSIESTQNRHQAESIEILKHWLLDNINRPYVFIIFSNNLNYRYFHFW